MNIKTIDQRLREKARGELKEKLAQAEKNFIRDMGINEQSGKINIPIVDKNGYSAGFAFAYRGDIIKAIVNEAFARLSPGAEEKKIEEFMERVDSLQDQIDQLHSLVE